MNKKRGNNAQVTELQRSLVSSFYLQLILLFGAVVLLLLMACANVGGLLLSRAASVEGEMAVRMALWASRLRLVQQQLTEILALTFCSGIVGLVLAGFFLRLISRLVPIDLPRISEMSIDGRVACFALLTSLSTAGACGL